MGAWAGGADAWPSVYTDHEARGPFVLRATDHEVIRVTACGGRTALRPLSVSTDRIAYATMRAAGLLARLAEGGSDVARDGSGLIAETYPAGALHQWGMSPRTDADDPGAYKGTDPAAVVRRLRVLERVAEAQWLTVLDAFRDGVRRSDDLLDALLCAVVARLITRRETCAVPKEHQVAARVEGWIHLPERSRT